MKIDNDIFNFLFLPEPTSSCRRKALRIPLWSGALRRRSVTAANRGKAISDRSRRGAEAPPAASPARGVDLLWVVAATAGTFLLLRRLLAGQDLTAELVLGLLLLQSLVPLAAVQLIVIRRRGTTWTEIGLRSTPGRWYRRALLAAVLAIPVVAAINHAVQRLTGTPFHNPQVEMFAPFIASPWELAAMLVITAVVAPIAEEVVFRGLLYGWLRRHMGVAAGVSLSALVFALAHGILILLPALVLLGVVTALLFERSRSLWPPILLHGAFNAIMITMLFALVAAGTPDG